MFETDEWKVAFIRNKKPVPQKVPELNTVIRLIAQRWAWQGDGSAPEEGSAAADRA